MKQLALTALLLLGACAATQPDATTPRTVERVELSRYLGTWHEAARLPQSFQDSARLRCTATTAEYAPLGPGRIRVTNACANALDPSAPRRLARGEAYVVEGSEGARLRVSFFQPFYGDYWVLGLDPDYRWAVVGSPSRRSLWVLSRAERMAEADLEAALAIARREGFDLTGLVRYTR
jgi:apolipoprotein D and lipocalin family protein